MPRIGRKAFALLVYLSLVPGGRVAREKLADLLWPDRSGTQGRNCLRQTLSVLRRMPVGGACGAFDGVFVAERDFIALLPGRIGCDACDLLGLGEDGGEAVAALYAGPFLAGFFSGSAVFDDWATAMRDRLDGLAVQAVHCMVRTAPPERGVLHLPRLLAIDPAREASYQLAMEVHAALRQRDQALRLYETCKAMLAREYDVSPSAETERIRRRILDGVQPAPLPLPVRGAGAKAVVRVMRFANLSDDARQERFLDGLMEAIVIELSHMREVTATLDPAGGEGAGGEGAAAAQFVLKGSLMAQGDRIEVIVRLVDAASGHTVAGDRFRGAAAEELDFLHRLSQLVALSTRFEVLQAGWRLQDLTPVDDVAVRLLVLRAHSRYYELTAESLRDAVRLAQEALRLDPSSLRAQRMLSLAISGSLAQGVVPRDPDMVARAVELARQVARAAPEDVFTRCVLAWALGNAGKHEAAVEELKYAIRLNPLYPTLHSDLAEHYAVLGYASEAIAECAEAIRLSADDVVSFWRYHSIAVAQFAAGNYADALENARRVMREKPGLLRGALMRAASAAALGLMDEAAQTMADVLRERPDLRSSTVSPGVMPRYVQQAHHVLLLSMLEKAGMPH